MESNLIDKFFNWAFEHRADYKPTVSALYFFLVMVCKKLNYQKEFYISAKECMEGMGVSSYNTYRSAFDVLSNHSLITVVERSANQYQANLIRINTIDDMSLVDTPVKTPASVAIPIKKDKEAELFENESNEPPPLTEKQKQKAEKAKKYKYAEFVTLTRDEYANLCAEYSEDAAKRMIEILDNYKGSKGKRYKSDYRAILNWVVNRYNEEIQKHGTEWKTINGRGCSTSDTGYATAEVPFDSGNSDSSSTKPSKDYSERF